MTRARELLILSGGTDTTKWPAPRNGGPPIDWIVRALTPTLQLPDILERHWEGRLARLVTKVITPETLPEEALQTRARTQQHTQPTALPSVPAKVTPNFHRGRPAPQRLSYSQLSDYAKCGYRFYLKRVLNLPNVEPPPLESSEEPWIGIDPMTRGSIVHAALEDLDFDAPRAPGADAVRALSRDDELSDEDVTEIQDYVEAFARSPLCRRLTQATRVTREAGFQFALDPDGSGPLVRGFVDVLATEPDGTHLVIDYKTDHVSEEDTPEAYVQRHYETQKLVYALAALRAGAPRVEVAYCLLERPDEPLRGRSPPRTRRTSSRASRRWPTASSRTTIRSPTHRTASCAERAPEEARSAATRRTRRSGLRRLFGWEHGPVVRLRQVVRPSQAHHRVELGAEQQREVRDPQPHEQDHGTREGAVRRGVGREVRDVQEEQGGGHDPQEHAGHRARE